MTIGTGSVPLSAIQTEFGGANPISLSEYYRGGANVPSGTADGGYGLIATSGAISVGTFRGTTKQFQFTQTISANTTNYNLRSSAVSAGWNGTQPIVANITVNSGVYVYATSTSGYAFDTGSPYPSGQFTLNLTNNGIIAGAGGAGGAGGSATAGGFTNGTAGSAGGIAMRIQAALNITNNGTVGGGGGGGGGGGAAKHSLDGGKTYYLGAGGGGGGGRVNGAGGAAGTASGGTAGNTTTQTAGGAGTLTAAGAAGARGVISGAVGAGTGGAGGGLGSNGSTGGTPDQGFVNGGQSSPGGGGGFGAAAWQGSLGNWIVIGTRLGGVF